MRATISIALLILLSACDSAAPKSKPWVITLSGDSAPRPAVSPNNSVRRSKPDEVIKGRAPRPGECAGDACGAVTVEWLDPGFRFENTGDRDVAITIWFAAKGDCLLSEFVIAPAQHSGWGNDGFCKPYGARYK